MKTRLIVFAKQPAPGQVKTRLQGALSPERAARLYRGFLEDVLAASTSCRSYDSAIAYWPPESRGWFETSCPAGYTLVEQRGAGLAERLRSSFIESFAEGWDAVIVRNSDSPDLPVERLEAATRALESRSLVIGPDLGGGYYLIGMRSPYRELFVDVPMDTESSLQATLSAANRADLEVELLDPHPDVDEPSDLDALIKRLRSDSDLARRTPSTVRALREIGRL